MERSPAADFATYRRLLFWAFGLTLVILFVWFVWKVLLLAFAGVLLATILSAFTEWVQARTGLRRGLSYAIVIVVLTVLVVAAIWALAPRVIAQTAEISTVLPKAIEHARDTLNQYDWGRYFSSTMDRAVERLNLASRVGELASALIEAVAGLIVVGVVGFFVALEPRAYERGALEVLPASQRAKAAKIFNEIGYTMRWWVLGQLVPMAVLGIGTMIGLWLLGIPLAFTLGLFTAVMLFVPYAGSVLSAIPAVLIALLQGPMKMVWVIALFSAVHALEGYVVTPLAQRRAVRLPPALTILAQLLMWEVAGLLGVALATPLTAAVIVLVKMLYLHEKPEH
jgi:predicted PurR-regulated permease PerM